VVVKAVDADLAREILAGSTELAADQDGGGASDQGR